MFLETSPPAPVPQQATHCVYVGTIITHNMCEWHGEAWVGQASVYR